MKRLFGLAVGVAASMLTVLMMTALPAWAQTDPCAGDDPMVKVGPICVDKFEAVVYDRFGNVKGNQEFSELRNVDNPYPCSPNGNDCSDFTGQPEKWITARSVPGVFPSSKITWFQAQQACANAGKRLLTNAEWQMAAAGIPDTVTFSGGPPFCNVGGTAVFVEGKSPTGSRAACVSNWGTFDMVRNLEEWVADWKEDNRDRGSTIAQTTRYLETTGSMV
jgi:formylglycine-generating enzyme required for sulfatase activity